MESRVEGIFLVLVDLCMNYWEIRLQSDLWRAALGAGCLGSVPRLALLWTGVRATQMGAVLAMRENGFLHQKFNIFLTTKASH